MFATRAAALQRPVGDEQNPHNTTTPMNCETDWSEETPPKVLGQLDPFSYRPMMRSHSVPSLVENGQIVTDAEDKPIRNFPFLPRYLASDLELFRMEAYFRYDPRLTYRDLWARMPANTPKFDKIRVRSLVNHMQRRVRARHSARCWDAKGHQLPRRNIELVERLTPEQLALNTTWEVRPGGIKRPGIAEFLPRNFYLEAGESVHRPSRHIREALAELNRLKCIARAQGKASWRDVKDAHPKAWYARCRKTTRTREVKKAQSVRSVRNAAPQPGVDCQHGRDSGELMAEVENDDQSDLDTHDIIEDTHMMEEDEVEENEDETCESSLRRTGGSNGEDVSKVAYGGRATETSALGIGGGQQDIVMQVDDLTLAARFKGELPEEYARRMVEAAKAQGHSLCVFVEYCRRTQN